MATLELSKNILKIKSKFLHIAVEFCLKVELRKNLIKQLKSVQNVCHQKNDSNGKKLNKCAVKYFGKSINQLRNNFCIRETFF